MNSNSEGFTCSSVRSYEEVMHLMSLRHGKDAHHLMPSQTTDTFSEIVMSTPRAKCVSQYRTDAITGEMNSMPAARKERKEEGLRPSDSGSLSSHMTPESYYQQAQFRCILPKRA